MADKKFNNFKMSSSCSTPKSSGTINDIPAHRKNSQSDNGLTGPDMFKRVYSQTLIETPLSQILIKYQSG